MADRSSAAAPPLHGLLPIALYLVAAALLAQGVAHALIVGGVSAPTWTLRWRFGFIGVVFLNLVYPLLGLAVGSLTAALARHRAMLYTFAILSGLLSFVAIASLSMFLLDAIQISATVPDQLRGGYSITVAHTSVLAGLAIPLLVWLTFGTLRGARHEGGHRLPHRPDGHDLLVGRG